ncbi:hypothetical protein [Leptolyngbya phage Lbo-JY46]
MEEQIGVDRGMWWTPEESQLLWVKESLLDPYFGQDFGGDDDDDYYNTQTEFYVELEMCISEAIENGWCEYGISYFMYDNGLLKAGEDLKDIHPLKVFKYKGYTTRHELKPWECEDPIRKMEREIKNLQYQIKQIVEKTLNQREPLTNMGEKLKAAGLLAA